MCLVTLGYVSYAQVKLWWCSLGMHDIFHRLLWFHTGLFIIRKVEFFTKKHMMGLFLFMCEILLTVHWVFYREKYFHKNIFHMNIYLRMIIIVWENMTFYLWNCTLENETKFNFLNFVSCLSAKWISIKWRPKWLSQLLKFLDSHKKLPLFSALN